MTTLDEIQARVTATAVLFSEPHDVMPTHYEDRAKLFNAVRAVEAVKPWNGDYPPYDNGYNTALQDVHAAIREALG